MRHLPAMLFLVVSSALTALAVNPVPFVSQPLVPAVATPGGPTFILTVHGAAFVKGATVVWDQTKLATQFIGNKTLQATVTADLIASPTTGLITVINPGNKVRSNIALLPVTTPRSFTITGGNQLETIDSPVDVATADFDRDGKLDYVSSVDIFFSSRDTNYTKSVIVGFSDGAGNTRTNKISLHERPAGVTTGDFNGDGQTDFAVVLGDLGVASVEVFLQSNGFFHAVSTTPTGILPQHVVTGDFNRDGRLDLAVEDHDGNAIIILLGNGDGTFTPGQTFAVSPAPLYITMEDFNGDGFLDLATPTWSGDVSVALGLGDGTFGAIANYPTSAFPPCAMSADFNEDAIPDLAVVGGSDNGIAILLGNGDGTFQPQKGYSTGIDPTNATFADFDGDGHLDLVVATEQGLSFLHGNGDGTFQKRLNSDSHLLRGALAPGDFRIDGHIDIVMDETSAGINILLQ